jgi:polysaccharide export outer membrane protein
MKNLIRLSYLLIMSGLMASCISNKRIVYLQDYDQKKPHNFLADTVFTSDQNDYRMETGDVVYVKSDHPQLSQSLGQIDENFMNDTRIVQGLPILAGFTVDAEGVITLPIIGVIPISGKTIFEVQLAVDSAASRVFPDPAIKVFLLNFFVTILGEVQRPGRYPVYNHKINIFEALGMAGDATDFASREEVKIVRNRDGVNHLYSVDLTDQDILSNPDFFLQPNDVLLVKPQKRKKYATRDVQNVYNAIGVVLSAITVYLLITR